MVLDKKDYVIESTTDGGYYAYLQSNMQCNAYGDTPDEAVENLATNYDEFIDEMYLVEEFV